MQNKLQFNGCNTGFFHISSLLFLCCIGSGEEKGVIFHDRIFGFLYKIFCQCSTFSPLYHLLSPYLQDGAGTTGFIGFIGGHIQYNSCLDAKPIMSVCLYSSLYLMCCPSSLQRSSASTNPYILGVCLFKLDDVFYQSFFQTDSHGDLLIYGVFLQKQANNTD